jgi:hypothetical protein
MKRIVIYTQRVPHSKHSTSVIKTNLLVRYKAKVAVCSEIHTKHINAMQLACRILRILDVVVRKVTGRL